MRRIQDELNKIAGLIKLSARPSKGGKYKVDFKALKRYNSDSSYIRMVKNDIKRDGANGIVKIFNIDDHMVTIGATQVPHDVLIEVRK